MILLKSKKIRFASASLVLAGLLAALSFPPFSTSIFLLILPPLAALLLSYFVLDRPQGIEQATILILPISLAFGIELNQYFFPNFHLAFKIGSWFSFFAVFYFLFLALNIFRVERIKGEGIPLERAAKPAIFLLTFLSAFLLLTVFYKLSLGVLLSTLIAFLIGFIHALNFFWFLTLSDLIERRFFLGSAVVGLGLAQVSLAFSFLPWEAFLRGLSEGVFLYAILGVARAYYEKHLRYAIVLEYIILSLAVFLFARFF